MQIHAFVLLFMLIFSKVDGSDIDPTDSQNLMKRTVSGGPWGAKQPKGAKVKFDSLSGIDGDVIFDKAWFSNKKVAEVFKENIRKMGITTKQKGKEQLLAETNFVQKWIQVAAKTISAADAEKNPDLVKQKSKQFLDLLYGFELQHAVRPPKTGKECLWSGHVANSEYARGEPDLMTPLETPPLMEVLSATFGTEHFKKGTAKDGFKGRWLPNVCPMFNAATVIYSSMMRPTGGVVSVYVNQIKEWSAFFDSEIPLFLKKGFVKQIKFIILSPPPSVAKIYELTVPVVAGKAKDTQAKVMEAFRSLDYNIVVKLWNNRFDVAVKENKQNCKGSEESHPFADASAGTRKEDEEADCIYRKFFRNWDNKGVKPGGKRVSASLTSDRFELQAFITTLLLFCVLLLSFYKCVLPPKNELNVIFNTEPSSHYTEFAQI